MGWQVVQVPLDMLLAFGGGTEGLTATTDRHSSVPLF